MRTPGLGAPLTGAVVHLSGIIPANNFFNTAFSYDRGGGMAANIQAPNVIPLPPAAMAGLGTLSIMGVIAIRRRSRNIA